MALINLPLPTSPFVWRDDPASFDRFPDFFVAHELARAPDCVTEPERRLLSREARLAGFRQVVAEQREFLRLSATLEGGVELVDGVHRTVEIICDLGARTLLAPVEIPVGVVTAIIGGPFFLWLLVRKA